MVPSLEYYPEAQEDEDRVKRNDRLRTRRPRKSVMIREKRTSLLVRLVGGRRDDVVERSEMWVLGAPFVPLDQIPARTEDEADSPVFYEIEGDLKDALARLLAASPSYALVVYGKARELGRTDVLDLLPATMQTLVRDGVYSPQVFQQAKGGGQSSYRILKGLAKGCPVAAAMLLALNN